MSNLPVLAIKGVAKRAAPLSLAAQTAWELGNRAYDAVHSGSLEPIITVREGFPVTNVAAGLGQTLGQMGAHLYSGAAQLRSMQAATKQLSPTSSRYVDNRGWMDQVVSETPSEPELTSPEATGYQPPFRRMRQRRRKKR